MVPDGSQPYRKAASEIFISASLSGYGVVNEVDQLRILIARLNQDIEDGLIGAITDRVSAEVFDDFLEHAEAYHKAGRKDEAAVICGVTFEDTVRRICRSHRIREAGVGLDSLISNLVKANVITELKAKRLRSSAALRTSAAHARWEEIDIRDVKPVIDLTRELIEQHLAGA